MLTNAAATSSARALRPQMATPKGRPTMRRRRRKPPGLRVDANGHSIETQQYVNVPYRFLNSDAFRSLGGAACKVYWELRSRFNGRNNGELHLSLEEAAALLRMGKATVARALRELVDKGFIKLTRLGQWHGRSASEYAVTDKGRGGEEPTHDWRQWRPEPGEGPRRPRYRQPAHKTKAGAVAAHQRHIAGSETDLSAPARSELEPVNDHSYQSTGSEVARCYNHVDSSKTCKD